MENLYNALVAPIIEINDKGEQVQRPPTPIMMRAARAIKQCLEINVTNNILVQQQSQQIQELMNQLRMHDESLRKDGGQASPVGSTESHDVQRSDSTSEAGGAPNGGSPDPC